MKVAAPLASSRFVTLLFVCLLAISSLLLPAPVSVLAQSTPLAPNGFVTGPASGDPLQIAMQYVRSHLAEYGLSPDDVADLRVADHYTTAHNGVTHIVLRQRLGGIDVFQGDIAVNVARDGSIINLHNGAVSQLAKRVNTRKPALSAQDTLVHAATALGLHSSSLQGATPTQVRAAQGVEQESEFLAPAYSADPIPVHLIYQPLEDGSVVLAWNMVLRVPNGQQWLDVRVDATTGAIVSQVDWSSSSGHDHAEGRAGGGHATATLPREMVAAPALAPDGASYLVYPFDVERPDLGSRTTVTNPADAVASPYGWHDTNGADGAEYTITRGNNTFTYADINFPNGYTTGDVTFDGGAGLSFAPSLDLTQQPSSYRDATITQLFYTTNMLHDTLYHYGFDEVSGNFQFNNYGRGGLGNDAVNAEAQDYAGLDNANFNTPPDGQTPQMQMYLSGHRGRLNVQAPALIAGTYYGGTSTIYAGSFDVTGDMVLAQDGDGAATDACSALTNAAAVSGKIVLVDRGTCEYSLKVQHAFNAGAIGVIIANNTGTDAIPDLGLGNAGVATIPSVGISYNDGQTLRNAMASQTVTLRLFSNQNDGSFDTGVVMHEYGHGLSNRLTGGPANSGCLSTSEARGLGEGWSDMLALMLLAKQSNTRLTPQTMGTWLMGQPSNGIGIRTYPYSTDTAVNPHTYATLNTLNAGSPHPIGEVWATILWEVYWDLVDAHGYDTDKVNGTGGNNLFLQLMIDGMKLQKCNPSFIDARDAILLADQVNNSGANQCLLWAAFARRGLGVSATGTDSSIINDSVEAFDVASTCTIDIEPKELDVCVATSPQLTAAVTLGSLMSGSVSLSASGLPGAVANFSPNPVTAPGSSALTMDLPPGTTPDVYTLSVLGGSESGTAKVYVANAVPAAPTLTAPANTAVDEFEIPTFTWNPASQAFSYTLEVASDAEFNQIVARESLRSTTAQPNIMLNSAQSYYWRVVGRNACGNVASAVSSFTVRTIPDVLLVDDDMDGPDVSGVYMAVLDELGVEYDWWDTDTMGTAEPPYERFALYKTVLWAGGPNAYGSIENATEQALGQYLDGDKCLVISAQDYFARKGTVTPFMQNYLGLASAVDDPGQTQITGAGLFAGLGPYTLNESYSTTNYADSYVPTASADVAFVGDMGAAGISSKNYRSILLGFAVEGLSSAAREAVIERALQRCAPSDLVASASAIAPATLLPGQPLSYTVAVTNTGMIRAKGVTMTLTLPSFLSDVQVSSSLPITATTAGVWSLGNLAVNASGTVTIQAKVDASVNSDRSGNLTATFGTESSDALLTNNTVQSTVQVEVPRISFVSASATAAESAGNVPVGVKLDRANPYAPTSATLSASGTATLGSDFTLSATTVTFVAGATSANATVALIDDTVNESNETVVLQLASPVGGQLGTPASTTLTITDNDQPTPDTDTTVKLYLPYIGR